MICRRRAVLSAHGRVRPKAAPGRPARPPGRLLRAGSAAERPPAATAADGANVRGAFRGWPYGGRLYPPSEVWCSRQRTLAVKLATEPGRGSSRLAPPSRRQREPVACRRGRRCTLGPGRRGITACRARPCRASEAAGGRAAVAEASRRPAWRSLVQWRKMRGRAPQPHPSVVESVPLTELQVTFAPERL